MSKRRYKSEDFKKVDWSQVNSRITGMRVIVAVDVTKENFVATVLVAQQRALVTFKWHHSLDTKEVLHRVVLLGDGRGLEAAMEPSGAYGDAMAWQLHQR